MIPQPFSPTAGGLRRRRLLAAALVVPLLAAAACTGGGETEAAGDPARVTYLTSFETFGRDVYPYVADAKGYFGEANLDVDVQPGKGIKNLEPLAAGTAQFAAVDMSAFIINIANGNTSDTGYTAIAAIHQLPAAAIMTIDPDITTPRDLAGKTVTFFQGGTVDLLFPAYAEQVGGLDPNDVNIQYGEPKQLPTLLASGTADAIEQFAMGQPLVQEAVRESGREVRTLPYSDVLTDPYGVVIVTTEQIAAAQPKLVIRFRDALLRGLDYSLTNPTEAGQILAEVEDSVVPVVAAAELEIMDAYSRLVNVPLGALDEVKVEQHIALLKVIGATGDFPGGMTAEDVITPNLIIPAG